MRTAAFVAVLLAFSAPLAAQRIDVVEMTSATLDELARNVVTPPHGRHEEPRRPAFAAKGVTASAVIAEVVPIADAAPAPPPVTRGFRSTFDPVSLTSEFSIPADASGAVGPHHVVGAYNSTLTVHDRNGVPLSSVLMTQFWHDPAYPDTIVYDPRVVYDAASDRWLLAMLTDTNLHDGKLLLAISASGDPTGAWRRFRIDAASDPNLYLDFTRMALTSDQIVVTANVFDGSYTGPGSLPAGTDILTIPRSPAFINMAAPVVTRTFTGGFDMTPVASADTTVRLLTQSASGITLYTLDGASLHLESAWRPSAPFVLGAIACQQLGTTHTIDCGDAFLHYALFRDGVLWVVQTANDGTRSEVAVWQIRDGAATTYLLGDPNTDYAYPSIAVNRYGTALVGYATFSSSMYPSAAYRTIDLAGNVSAPGTVKDGEDWYILFRWGDYSSTLVDPVDDSSFWTLQCYTPSNVNPIVHGSWATWWSYVQVKAPRVRAVRH